MPSRLGAACRRHPRNGRAGCARRPGPPSDTNQMAVGNLHPATTTCALDRSSITFPRCDDPKLRRLAGWVNPKASLYREDFRPHLKLLRRRGVGPQLSLGRDPPPSPAAIVNARLRDSAPTAEPLEPPLAPVPPAYATAEFCCRPARRAFGDWRGSGGPEATAGVAGFVRFRQSGRLALGC